jgi:hypothetical protein
MKKILYIDVGTHFGQEYDVLFRGPVYSTYRIVRSYAAFLLRKSRVRLSLKDAFEVFELSLFLQKHKSYFLSILVEPNPKLFSRFCYRACDVHLPVALSDDSGIRYGELFYSGGDETGQGSSIFSNKRGAVADNFAPVIVANSLTTLTYIFETIIRGNSDFSDATVILRLNCEGSEDEVIYATREVFGDSFLKVFGSLKDVLDIKGLASYDKLELFLTEKAIIFEKFTPSIDTWLPALRSIKSSIIESD